MLDICDSKESDIVSCYIVDLFGFILIPSFIFKGPDGSVDPFAARAIASYKTTPFSFKKGQIVNVLRKQVDPNGVCLYYGTHNYPGFSYSCLI